MYLKFRAALALAMPVFALAGCSPDLSPDTYNSAAVQQANKTDQGIVVGVRQVDVKVSGQTGAVAGAAAGGVIGGSVPGSSTGQALGTVGGGLLGGLLGSSVEQAAGDTKAWEYIVRKKSGELVSVTQTGEVPLALGQKVLVIAGVQARIVPDYTVNFPDDQPAKKPVEVAIPILTPPSDADSKPAPAPVPAPAADAVVVPPTTNPAAAAAEKLFTSPSAASAAGSDPAIPVPEPAPKAKD